MSDDLVIEDGMVMGFVRTNKVGSECDFAIVEVEEWEKMTEGEQTQALIDAANESGVFEICVDYLGRR